MTDRVHMRGLAGVSLEALAREVRQAGYDLMDYVQITVTPSMPKPVQRVILGAQSIVVVDADGRAVYDGPASAWPDFEALWGAE